MNIENTEKLLKKYPKIFRQHKLSPMETCMCWGFECGNGWYHLIDNLCSSLQQMIDDNGYGQIEAVQVKEKFGGLNFYTTTIGDYELGKYEFMQGMINFAENLSFSICEECGSMKDVTQTKGWIKTLCKECMNAL